MRGRGLMGNAIAAFGDMTIAPIGLDDVEIAVAAVLDDREGGHYQVSAMDDLSYAEIARHLARRLGRSPDLFAEGSAVASGIPAAEVTRFTSLDTSRLKALTRWRPPSGLAVIDRVFAAYLTAPT